MRPCAQPSAQPAPRPRCRRRCKTSARWRRSRCGCNARPGLGDRRRCGAQAIVDPRSALLWPDGVATRTRRAPGRPGGRSPSRLRHRCCRGHAGERVPAVVVALCVWPSGTGRPSARVGGPVRFTPCGRPWLPRGDGRTNDGAGRLAQVPAPFETHIAAGGIRRGLPADADVAADLPIGSGTAEMQKAGQSSGLFDLVARARFELATFGL